MATIDPNDPMFRALCESDGDHRSYVEAHKASVVSDGRGVSMSHETFASLVGRAQHGAANRRFAIFLAILSALSGSAFGAGAMRIFGCH